ncbi:MAG: hypothetical protein RR931_04720, partial [Mucinivorans sp.]
LMVISLMFTVSASAQDFKDDPKWGEDPAHREENVKLYNAFLYSVKLKDMNQASKELQMLLQRAPKCSENLYINGSRIYTSKLASATTKAERSVYIDSIMLLFDKRAESFGNHATRGKSYILGQKALAFLNYSPEQKQKAFDLFEQAVAAGQQGPNPVLIGTYFTALTESYQLDDITPEKYVMVYEKLSALLNAVPEPRSLEVKDAITAVESLFASSGAASCENIDKIFKPKYDADPDNEALIKQILALCQRSKCSGEFYMQLIEKYYQIDPKPELAVMLAGVYEEKKDFAKALEFMNIAIKSETDPAAKVSYMTRAAGHSLSMGLSREAAVLARQIISMDDDNGFAYYIYASALANGSSQACGGFDRQAAYWLVVDAFQQAKAHMTADDPQLASVNTAIGSYAANFPKDEELFMRGLESGQGYSVNCGWISGHTTVRGR